MKVPCVVIESSSKHSETGSLSSEETSRSLKSSLSSTLGSGSILAVLDQENDDFMPLDFGTRTSQTGSLLGREREQKTILDTIGRVQIEDAPTEAVLVHGMSGVGKTHLIKTALASGAEVFPTANLLHGYGKYNQDDNPQPYSAIVYAVSDICFEVSNFSEAEIAETKERINDAFDTQELRILVETIPAISALAAVETLSSTKMLDESSSNGEHKDAVLTNTAIIRFNNLFRRFLTTLASAQHPVILFLDDLQVRIISHLYDGLLFLCY